MKGLAVTLLVLVGLREVVMNAVPASLKHAIAVRIGCFTLLVAFSLMLTDFFDTMGTIIGVSGQIDDVDAAGRVERLRPMLLVDSLPWLDRLN